MWSYLYCWIKTLFSIIIKICYFCLLILPRPGATFSNHQLYFFCPSRKTSELKLCSLRVHALNKSLRHFSIKSCFASVFWWIYIKNNNALIFIPYSYIEKLFYQELNHLKCYRKQSSSKASRAQQERLHRSLGKWFSKLLW